MAGSMPSAFQRRKRPRALKTVPSRFSDRHWKKGGTVCGWRVWGVGCRPRRRSSPPPTRPATPPCSDCPCAPPATSRGSPWAHAGREMDSGGEVEGGEDAEGLRQPRLPLRFRPRPRPLQRYTGHSPGPRAGGEGDEGDAEPRLEEDGGWFGSGALGPQPLPALLPLPHPHVLNSTLGQLLVFFQLTLIGMVMEYVPLGELLPPNICDLRTACSVMEFHRQIKRITAFVLP